MKIGTLKRGVTQLLQIEKETQCLTLKFENIQESQINDCLKTKIKVYNNKGTLIRSMAVKDLAILNLDQQIIFRNKYTPFISDNSEIPKSSEPEVDLILSFELANDGYLEPTIYIELVSTKYFENIYVYSLQADAKASEMRCYNTYINNTVLQTKPNSMYLLNYSEVQQIQSNGNILSIAELHQINSELYKNVIGLELDQVLQNKFILQSNNTMEVYPNDNQLHVIEMSFQQTRLGKEISNEINRQVSLKGQINTQEVINNVKLNYKKSK